MVINDCLLSAKNSFRLGGKRLGDSLSDRSLANLWEERSKSVDTIVIHCMCNPQAGADRFALEAILPLFLLYEVSAHFLILRDGEVLRLVPTAQKAWHAGPSEMPVPDSRSAVNDFSIGIELAGDTATPFTAEQYQSLNALLATLKEKYPITAILGHSDIAGEALVQKGKRTEAKVDPGPHFKWDIIGGKVTS